MALDGKSLQAIQLEFSFPPVRHRPRAARSPAAPVRHEPACAEPRGTTPRTPGSSSITARCSGPATGPRTCRRGGLLGCATSAPGSSEDDRPEAGPPAGRLARGCLLAELALCPALPHRRMRVETGRQTRKDGTRSRRYVCQSASRGPSPGERPVVRRRRPVDADSRWTACVVSGIDRLLADADALRRGQLLAGRRAEQGPARRRRRIPNGLART